MRERENSASERKGKRERKLEIRGGSERDEKRHGKYKKTDEKRMCTREKKLKRKRDSMSGKSAESTAEQFRFHFPLCLKAKVVVV